MLQLHNNYITGPGGGGWYCRDWGSDSHQPVDDYRGCGYYCLSIKRVHHVSTESLVQFALFAFKFLKVQTQHFLNV